MALQFTKRTDPPLSQRFYALAHEEVLVVEVLREIGAGPWGRGVCAEDVQNAINASTAPTVRLLINSLGGDCLEAIGIVNCLLSCGRRIEAHVAGVAASAASAIMCAACQVSMVEVWPGRDRRADVYLVHRNERVTAIDNPRAWRRRQERTA